MKKGIFLIIVMIFIAGCKKGGDLVISDATGTDLSVMTREAPIITETESSAEEIASTENPNDESVTAVPGTSETPAAEIVTVPGTAVTTETEATTATAVEFTRPTDNDITITAQSLLGVPFADGGTTPETGFDNSGFIHYVLTQNGFLSTPRRVSEQAEMGDKINSMDELRSGDLVFFSTSGTRPEYGGIYIGDGIMIYSPMPGETVKEQNIGNTYWRNTFYIGIRVL